MSLQNEKIGNFFWFLEVPHAAVLQEIEQVAADAFVHRTRVAFGGEYLAVVASAVLFYHATVEGVVVAHTMGGGEFVVGRHVVGFVVHDGIQTEAFAATGLFFGVAHGDGDDGHHSLGAIQQFGNLACVVVDRAKIAESEATRFGSDADVLCAERGIDEGRGEPQQVAVGLVALVDAAVLVVASHVGADGEPDGGRGTLSEVELAELAAEGLLPGDDDAVELHVAGVGGTQAALQQLVEQGGGYGFGGELTHRAVGQ